jgi:hypothetical protein
MKNSIKKTIDAAIDLAEQHDLNIQTLEMNNKSRWEFLDSLLDISRHSPEEVYISLNDYRGHGIKSGHARLKLEMVSKCIAMLVILATFAACAARPISTSVAKGDIKFPNEQSAKPYKVLIKDYNRKTGDAEWIQWDPWAINESYLLNVKTNDRVDALFIALCGGDTLAKLTVRGGYSREKIKRDILLDGSTYEFGSAPFNQTAKR